MYTRTNLKMVLFAQKSKEKSPEGVGQSEAPMIGGKGARSSNLKETETSQAVSDKSQRAGASPGCAPPPHT